MIFIEGGNGFSTRAAEAKPDDKVTAVYKGEQLLHEQSFSVTVDGKEYEWSIQRETPVMTFIINDDESIAEYDLATWVPLGADISAGDSSKTKKANTSVVKPSRLNQDEPPDVKAKPVKLGAMAMTALEAVKKNAGKPANTEKMNPVRTFRIATETLLGLALVSVSALTIYSRTYDLLNAEDASKNAAEKARLIQKLKKKLLGAKNKKGGGGRRPKGGGKKAKKPHPPGWPASNFRRGKGAGKGKGHSKKAAEMEPPVPTSMTIVARDGYRAPFDIDDSSIELRESMAVSVSVLDADGFIIWETEDIFVPVNDGETLVPRDVQIGTSVMYLLAEAQSYVEFLAENPDLTVEIE